MFLGFVVGAGVTALAAYILFQSILQDERARAEEVRNDIVDQATQILNEIVDVTENSRAAAARRVGDMAIDAIAKLNSQRTND